MRPVLGPEVRAGQDQTGPGAPQGFALASADLPTSVSTYEMGQAGKRVPET